MIMNFQDAKAASITSVEQKLTTVNADLEAEKAVKGDRVKSLQSQASRLRKHLKLLQGELYGDSNRANSVEITPAVLIARIGDAQTEIEEQRKVLKANEENALGFKAYKKIASLQSKVSVSRKSWRKLTGESECPA